MEAFETSLPELRDGCGITEQARVSCDALHGVCILVVHVSANDAPAPPAGFRRSNVVRAERFRHAPVVNLRIET
jgi:hypothetical protein